MSDKKKKSTDAAKQDPAMATVLEKYSVVIGLEVHCQLNTKTKLFCDCANEFGSPPNQNTCPVCLGHPGVLPVLNKKALHLAIQGALMFGCEIQEFSKFDRKHYFYPDLPKGYQISQFDLPFALGGTVELTDGRKCGLERIHLEEDAGKNTHQADNSIVDFNRAGVPLIEIVGLPDMETPADAHDWLENLRRALRYSGVSECDMEKGSLRCDANVSLRPIGQEEFGTKVEVKNLNSFSMVERALIYEILRQAEVLDAGSTLDQETRLFNEVEGVTKTMRKKEGATDYRYLPEPDLPPVVLTKATIGDYRSETPESHWTKKARFQADHDLSDYDAMVLTLEQDTAEFFESSHALMGDAKLVANWVMTEVLREVNESGQKLADFAMTPARLTDLLGEIQGGKVSHQGARKVFRAMVEKVDHTADALIQELGLAQISDRATLEPLVQMVVDNSAKAVKDYKNGKMKALDSMKGMVMRETKGRANPNMVSDILLEILQGLED